MVLAPAFINTLTIRDLDAEQSDVSRFLERGFDVYLVDWGDRPGSTRPSPWTTTSAGTSVIR